MSFDCTRAVWQHSRQTGSGFLVLLALADYADSQGFAHPGVTALAAKCRMSKRNAQLVLAALRDSGELTVRTGAGPHGTNSYQVLPRLFDSPVDGGLAHTHEAAFTTHEGSFTPTHEGSFIPAREEHYMPYEVSSTPIGEVGFSQTNTNTTSDGSPAKSQVPAMTDPGTRLLADWVLPEAWREFCVAQRPRLNPEHVAADFKSHYLVATGPDACKVDWLSAWRLWVHGLPKSAKPSPRKLPNLRPPANVLHADEVLR
ncbi:hypothetical protein [Ideonella sp.]|uniref:hypothetical protein n=1 Tax=Ideonella sp. TaxID=1929293 RepID=UPI003BB732EF